MQPHDRRRQPRISLQAAAKVYDYKARRYLPARTVDVSSGGAMIELLRPSHVATGDRIDVAVDWTGGSPVIRHGQMTAARVVRVEGRTHMPTRFALRFTTPMQLPAAA
jgi:hypothetical protein